MPLGKTPILQNDLMAEGDNQKYLLFNDALVNLEDADNRNLAVDLSSGNVALTETQTLRFTIATCSGHSVARTLTLPTTVGSPPIATNRKFAVRNDGTGAITVTHNNSGTELVVPVGETALIYADGTNIISLGGVANSATMPLNEDGVEVISALLSLNLEGTGFTITDDGNGAATVTFSTPESFTDLDDVPTDYTGQSGKVLAVNSGENAVEFIDPPAMADADVKTAYENNADTNAFTDAEKTKLTGVETGATADQTGAEIKAAYEAEADTNAFTDAEKSKLAGLDGSTFKGTYLNATALDSAHPAPEVGSYAYVDAGIGSEIELYIWDDDDSEWVQTGGAGSSETAASIKTKYESNADTNAFTDAEQTKLSGVETGATADQTDSEIETAYNNQVGQVSAGEITAGTETAVRRFSPKDVADIASAHGGGGGSSLPTINSGDAGKALVVNGAEDGTEWASVGGGGTSMTLVSSTGTNHDVTNGNLGGNVVLKCSNASANTVTVPSGLTGTEPLTIVQTGTGQTTVAAGSGVTISSLSGNLAIAGQYGSATLIPNGSDNYILVGALA